VSDLTETPLFMETLLNQPGMHAAFIIRDIRMIGFNELTLARAWYNGYMHGSGMYILDMACKMGDLSIHDELTPRVMSDEELFVNAGALLNSESSTWSREELVEYVVGFLQGARNVK